MHAKAGSDTEGWKVFQPVRISDNWCWHYAFTRINICHRIDANDLAILRHDAGLLTIQVEPIGPDACPTTHPAANPENRSPELTG